MFLHLEYLAELLLQLEKESRKIDRDICTADYASRVGLGHPILFYQE